MKSICFLNAVHVLVRSKVSGSDPTERVSGQVFDKTASDCKLRKGLFVPFRSVNFDSKKEEKHSFESRANIIKFSTFLTGYWMW